MKLPHALNPIVPFGQTLGLAVVILALLAGMFEGAVRLLVDESDLPVAIGSANPTLDIKIGVLDRLARESGGVDCIFLGSSVVNNGVIPASFAAAYRDQTGEDITCYNFGVPALTASTAGVLAEVLVERYRPRLLVYGFTVRALAEQASEAQRVYDDIVNTPWVRAQRGAFDVLGWLVEHSQAFRHYLAYRNWMRHDFDHELRRFKDAPPDGYISFMGTRAFDPNAVHVPDYFTQFAMSDRELAGLERIFNLNHHTAVLAVEMPLPDFVIAGFEGGAAAHRAVFDELAELAAGYDVLLWQASPQNLIPGDGWAEDGLHVNDQGAEILSAWLGAQVGRAVRDGALSLTPR